jgi:hypothetical protein
MQRKKNIRLLIVFLALLVWTVLLMNMDFRKSRIAIDETKFSVLDTTSINKISLTHNNDSTILSRENNGWMVNNKYPVDPSMKEVLMAVLSQVRVKRTVPKKDSQRIQEELRKSGYIIEILQQDGQTTQYYAGGNGISISYFMNPEELPYVVHLPGYDSYVTGIFEVSENDWRDRLLFQTSWMGIKEIQFLYPDNPVENLSIISAKDLYEVSGIDNLDTTKLMTFLDQISYFYTDQYLSAGQIESYDSLKKTNPFLNISIDYLGLEHPTEISFYRGIPGENVILGLVNKEQMCLFNQNRISFLFKRKQDFIK